MISTSTPRFNGSAQDVRRIYAEKLYPNLHPHQTALLVPAGYSCSDKQTRVTSCGSTTGDCTAVMLEWARFAMGGRVIKCPPPSARNHQSQL